MKEHFPQFGTYPNSITFTGTHFNNCKYKEIINFYSRKKFKINDCLINKSINSMHKSY